MTKDLCCADEIPTQTPRAVPTEIPIFSGINSLTNPPTLGAPVQSLNDVLLSVGGPVWSLDWYPMLPDADGREAATQYLAVCVQGT